MRQSLVTLDMEGVLTPEIWIAVAEQTGVEELKLTTRDIPDYDELMQGRLRLLRRHGIGLSRIQAVIAKLEPLEGAKSFLRDLRSIAPTVVLSDTFEQFAQPLLQKLEQPLLLCHRLEVKGDRILNYRLRLPDQKRRAVAAFQELNYRVIAAGDSYNDIGMLQQADAGILFRAPENVRREFPQFPCADDHSTLLDLIRKRIEEGE